MAHGLAVVSEEPPVPGDEAVVHPRVQQSGEVVDHPDGHHLCGGGVRGRLPCPRLHLDRAELLVGRGDIPDLELVHGVEGTACPRREWLLERLPASLRQPEECVGVG
jgi:hypothetical protein